MVLRETRVANLLGTNGYLPDVNTPYWKIKTTFL